MFTYKSYIFGNVKVYTIEFGEFDPTPHIEVLNEEEKIRVNRFVLGKRQREFVATRILKEKILPKSTILYNSLGAPYIENGPYISISHSPTIAGIAVCENHPIGFDLEPIREKVQRIKTKFLHPHEYKTSDTEDTETLIKLWSGKEALYKLACREEVIFAEDLLITQVEQTNWLGYINQPDGVYKTEMCIFTEKETVVSVTTSDVQRTDEHILKN